MIEGNPYLAPEKVAALITWDDVERDLVEAFALWRRSPGGGRWPFASDGPWYLMTRRLEDGDVPDDPDARPLPLTAQEVKRRDQASAWIETIPSDIDRRIVCLAVRALAGSHDAVPWTKLRRQMGTQITTDGLRKRYSRALAGICAALNARTF